MKNLDGFVDSMRNLKSLLFPFCGESVSVKMKSKPTCAAKINIQLKVDVNMLAGTKRNKREAPGSSLLAGSLGDLVGVGEGDLVPQSPTSFPGLFP